MENVYRVSIAARAVTCDLDMNGDPAVRTSSSDVGAIGPCFRFVDQGTRRPTASPPPHPPTPHLHILHAHLRQLSIPPVNRLSVQCSRFTLLGLLLLPCCCSNDTSLLHSAKLDPLSTRHSYSILNSCELSSSHLPLHKPPPCTTWSPSRRPPTLKQSSLAYRTQLP